MKQNIALITILLTTLCFLFSCSNDIENNSDSNKYLKIQDASFEAILINKGIDSDSTINQQMLRVEAEAVVELDLGTLEHGAINDLSGIEGFSNLKKLIANQHDIEQIDLSSNILLDTVYLAGNYISKIDVSKNTNLELLDLGANELTAISGLSELIKLKDLDLSFNYFEEINIDNQSLEILHMSNNDLISMDFSAALNLTNILLTSNKLTSLDISSNKKLETLLVSDNQLQFINLAENNDLTYLYITSNLLTSLDVSNNLNLIDLKVDRNPHLNCIKIESGQIIPSLSISDYQEVNDSCQ
ncbi:hypothetical protein [Flexithrix dorotheae]|uniref:hypothetical protein n=1 Tax=Flexithrix dorotheae TaxID=70993 RepID=UPI00035CF6BA|nr:hypothetical protein [Flexithrix dorotheae]